MDKRYRDADDEPASASASKRMRISDVSSAMQAVAHEALAMSNGAGFTAVNKGRSSISAPSPAPAPAPAAQSHPHPHSHSHSLPQPQQPLHPSTPDRRNSFHTPNAASRTTDSARVVMASPASHGHSHYAPADRSNGAIDPLAEITQRFKTAVVNGWSRRSPTYHTVDVMLLYWEDDELEVKNSVLNLESAFRSSLNYPTELFTIRSSSTSLENIRNKAQNFLTKDQSLDRLAILYYSGQCISVESPDGQPPSLSLVPRNRRAGGSLPFAPIQSAYESTGCDVLLLMDHSEALPFLTLGQRPNSRNVVELIVAPAPDPELGLVSFTKALTEELSHASHEEPFKVDALHSTISRRISISKPRGRGRPPKEPQARPPVDQQYLPKHQIFYHRRSVVLAPLPKEPQVIICVRALGGATDVNVWCQWIYSANPKARNSVLIEGMYMGYSTVIVLRVPVAEWHNFPPCPSLSFVGYTTFGDIPPKTLERINDQLSAKLYSDSASPAPYQTAMPPVQSIQAMQAIAAMPEPEPVQDKDPLVQPIFGIDAGSRGVENETDASGRKPRKALPNERRLLPSGAPIASQLSRRKEPPLAQSEQFRPTQQHLQYRDTVQQQSRQTADKNANANIITHTDPQLEAAAQRPVKISIKQANQSYTCKECTAGFKDIDALHNHVRKQHTRPFHCVFNWAGCESTFASKNEWKRHVMSQHILLHYWVCQVEPCSKIVNKAPNAAHSKFSLPNGAIFNRKDLYTQHLRRMHTPLPVKKLIKQAKNNVKPPSNPAITDWESHLRELQEGGIRPRCRLPDYMRCPVHSCSADFHGVNAWDERMEHVARHLEAAAAGREQPVVFGGQSDPTLTDWATRYEVGIAKRVGPNTWHLDNPLRPEIMEWTGDPGVAVFSADNTETEDAQSLYQSQAESYEQQNQYLHQHQHQHHFQVAPQPAQPLFESPEHPQAHPETHTQHHFQVQPQYTEQADQSMTDTANNDAEAVASREQPSSNTQASRDMARHLARSAFEAVSRFEMRGGAAEPETTSEPVEAVTSEAEAEAAEPEPVSAITAAPTEPAEDHSPIESTTDATTPKSTAPDAAEKAEKTDKRDKTPTQKRPTVYDDDDERPNEDEITVATGSPRRG